MVKIDIDNRSELNDLIEDIRTKRNGIRNINTDEGFEKDRALLEVLNGLLKYREISNNKYRVV